MATFLKREFILLSFVLLTACAEQPVGNKPIQSKPAAAAKPAQPVQSVAPVTPATSAAPTTPAQPTGNVRVSKNEGHSGGVDGAYYVQNRILSSGGVVSGAIMGS
jgi:hypothetical protein